MPKVQWDVVGARAFETGVDRGMLYVPPLAGVPWNGLVNISENPTGGAARGFYVDGEKYLNLSSLEEPSATIEAFSSPPEFAPCEGLIQLAPGLFACDQRCKAFSLSYRTLLGDDVRALSAGYRVHLIYNVTAKLSEFIHETMSQTVPMKTHTWTISMTPEDVPSVKPASHFVVNSLNVDPAGLASVEDILYGTDTDDPRFPTVSELMGLVGS